MSKLKHLNRAPIEDQVEDEVEYLHKRLMQEQEQNAKLYRGLRRLQAQVAELLNE